MKDPSEHVRPKSWPGVFTIIVGLAFAGLAFLEPTQIVKGEVGLMTGALLQAAAGVGVATVGLGWAVWASTRPAPPQPRVEAHVAFSSRQSMDHEVRAIAAKVEVPPGLAVPAAKRATSGDELLDQQIRAKRAEIQKAKVMFGMDKLSKDGYQKYVTQLKQELALLEAKSVKSEFAGKRTP